MAEEKKQQLNQLRSRIDELDSQIIDKLNERLRVAIKIGRLKSGGKIPVFHPEREKQVISNIVGHNSGGVFPKNLLINIYTEIMSASRSLQSPLRIAYLGPKATYTHMALCRHFGSAVEGIPVESIEETFRAVENGKTAYGVVPVENSTEGVVTHTLDRFVDSQLNIVSEIYMNISHCLLSRCTDIKAIGKIYSHPQSFSQCRLWLNSNLSSVEKMETSSNSRAAEMAAEEESAAAIAGKIAGGVYDLNILASHIEDNPENMTRFLVIGKDLCKPTDRDKTSLVCSVKDRPGALHDLLSAFSSRNINMTRIESRPTRKKAWQYLFFIDLEGHVEDPAIRQTLEELEETTQYIHVLGSYPVGSTVFE